MSLGLGILILGGVLLAYVCLYAVASHYGKQWFWSWSDKDEQEYKTFVTQALTEQAPQNPKVGGSEELEKLCELYKQKFEEGINKLHALQGRIEGVRKIEIFFTRKKKQFEIDSVKLNPQDIDKYIEFQVKHSSSLHALKRLTDEITSPEMSLEKIQEHVNEWNKSYKIAAALKDNLSGVKAKPRQTQTLAAFQTQFNQDD